MEKNLYYKNWNLEILIDSSTLNLVDLLYGFIFKLQKNMYDKLNKYEEVRLRGLSDSIGKLMSVFMLLSK